MSSTGFVFYNFYNVTLRMLVTSQTSTIRHRVRNCYLCRRNLFGENLFWTNTLFHTSSVVFENPFLS